MFVLGFKLTSIPDSPLKMGSRSPGFINTEYAI